MPDHQERVSIPVTRGTMEAKGPTTVRVTTTEEGKMADEIEGVSEDEARQVKDVTEALEAAHDSLQEAEGPADDLWTTGVVKVLDEVTDAKKMVEGALRKLQLLSEEA